MIAPSDRDRLSEAEAAQQLRFTNPERLQAFQTSQANARSPRKTRRPYRKSLILLCRFRLLCLLKLRWLA